MFLRLGSVFIGRKNPPLAFLESCPVIHKLGLDVTNRSGKKGWQKQKKSFAFWADRSLGSKSYKIKIVQHSPKYARSAHHVKNYKAVCYILDT